MVPPRVVHAQPAQPHAESSLYTLESVNETLLNVCYVMNTMVGTSEGQRSIKHGPHSFRKLPSSWRKGGCTIHDSTKLTDLHSVDCVLEEKNY